MKEFFFFFPEFSKTIEKIIDINNDIEDDANIAGETVDDDVRNPIH